MVHFFYNAFAQNLKCTQKALSISNFYLVHQQSHMIQESSIWMFFSRRFILLRKNAKKCPIIAVTFFSRRFSFKGKMPDYSSYLFFPSDYNPHTDRSTFLTILTILKSYNSYLANCEVVFLHHLRNSKGTRLKYFRLCETFPTERMLKNPKGSPLSVFSAL